MAAGLFIAAIVFAVLAITGKHGQLVAGVFALVLFASGLHMSRSGIRVGSAGVTVVGLFIGTRKILWAELDHFAAKPFGRYPAVAYAVLKDGRQYRALALCSTTRVNPGVDKSVEKVQAAVDSLNQLLEGHRSGASSQTGVPAGS